MKPKSQFALLFLLFVHIASAQLYTITDLGPLSPTAINIWGQVAGNLNGQAFIWTQFAGLKGLARIIRECEEIRRQKKPPLLQT